MFSIEHALNEEWRILVKKRRKVSRNLFILITFAFNFVVLFISLRIKGIYNLNLLVYMCFTVPLLILGDTLINKFIVVNKSATRRKGDFKL